MLVKHYSPSGRKCRVTFKLPQDVDAQTATLCGEFNGWDIRSHPMRKLKDGGFSLTISLEAWKEYRFRYLLDGERWENDWQADGYRPNEFDSEDSILIL